MMERVEGMTDRILLTGGHCTVSLTFPGWFFPARSCRASKVTQEGLSSCRAVTAPSWTISRMTWWYEYDRTKGCTPFSTRRTFLSRFR